MKYRAVVLLTALYLGIPAGWAQVNKSNLTGVVQDSTGAAIPGATIRLVNLGTSASRATTTNATGLYRFTLLDFGSYRLEAESTGFKRFVQTGIQLETGETTTVDIVLEVGEVTESVTITAESPLLKTESGAVGTTVNRQVLNELPLIGRNPYIFLTLSPGIQYTGSPGALNQWDNFGPADFTSSGSEARSEFLLDGIPNMRIDLVGFSPSPDAVQEMRVQTNAYDAEYGHSGAAFVNVSSKTGANDYHGTLFWFLRNDNLNANSFFNNRNNQAKNESKWNTYGFSIGGPASIPKLFDGRDKTHFSVTFEGTQIRGNAFSQAVVPTELERQGDFSQTRSLAGNPFTVYDPATTRTVGGAPVRDPFPGNRIPGDRHDPVARSAMNFYPMPNLARTSENMQNFGLPRLSGRRWASIATRGDHQFSSNHSLFLRFGWNHRTDPSSPFYGADCCFAAGNPTTGQDEFERGNIAAGAGHTWVVSPSTVVDFRLGYTRYFDANIMYGAGFDVASLGFPETFARSISFATFPRFEMSGDVDNLGAGRTSSHIFINQYNPLMNVHQNFGRHAVKYGFRYQVAQQNNYNAARAGGFFLFDRIFTQGPDPTRTTTTAGHDIASFLLGTPSRGFTDINAAPALTNKYYALYVQDDWKATNRLTLNLGLRFEHEGPTSDRFNRGNAGFDFNVASPLQAAAQANYAQNPIPELSQLNVPGGLRFLGVDGTPRGHLNMPTALWAPRFGTAFRINNWMVWRGGYGIFYVPNNVANYRLDGFSLATQMVTSLDNNLTPFHTLRNPFPNGLTRPPGAEGGLLTGVGQNITAGNGSTSNYVPDFKQGLGHQFSTGFQTVLANQVSVEANYVGNYSDRLTISQNVNEFPNEFLALRNRLNASVANPFFGVITDPTSALSQRNTTVSQLLRPFPHFRGFTQSVMPIGSSRYHSLQVQANKRMSGGLTFGVSYTASKLMEQTAFLNPNDSGPESVISNSDRPQRLVLHGLYEMPFGRGKRFMTSAHPALDAVLGGWQVNWVVTFQSMNALEFTTPALRLHRSDNNPKTVERWFDTSQFAPQEPFTLRDLSSRIADLRAPGIRKWDVTAMKSFRITERIKWDFRAEMYNIWNTTHFGAPNTVVTSPNFGRITGLLLGPREIQMATRLHF